MESNGSCYSLLAGSNSYFKFIYKSGSFFVEGNEELINTASIIRDVIASRGYVNPLAEMLGEQPNPFKKMCYVASALLYELYDGKGMTLYKKKDDAGEYHWWIKTDAGDTIDITAEQYTIEGREVPSSSYDGAEIAEPMWFPSYKKRIAALKEELLGYLKK